MAYFEETEQILYLSTNQMEKQMIEDGINRKLNTVRSVTGLVEEVGRDIQRQGRVNIIITKSMGKQFKARLEDIAIALNTLSNEGKLLIIEIGIGKVFDKALTFVDVMSFIEFVRTERRIARVGKLDAEGTDEAKKESDLMRELMIEAESSKEKVKLIEGKLKEKEDEVEKLESKYQKLVTKVEHVYVIKLENLENELKHLKEELSELERLHRVEKAKVKDYESEVSGLRSRNKGLELEKESLEELNKRRRQEMHARDLEIKTLNGTIGRMQEERDEILRTRVDAEAHVILSKELDKSRSEYVELQRQYEGLKVEARVKDYQISDLQSDIDELRRGEEDLQYYGRTYTLDSYRFESTDVYYIKVITELPYLVSAIKEFHRNIKEKMGGRTHVMVLRNNEGIDNMLYDGLELYGTLGDVRSEDEIFRLYPSRKMFTGADDFDGKVKSLIVVDFIRSNDYYIDTESYSKIITVVKDSRMIQDYGLRGTPVSLDAGTMYDIRHDEKIELSSVKSNREGIIRGKVQTWMRNIGIL